MILRRWSSLVVLLAATSCDSSPVSPGVQALEGRWLWGPEALQPAGSFASEFVVHHNGRTENRIVNRGLYAGQRATDVSATQVLYGRIAVVGDRFIVHPDSEVTEDLFHRPRHLVRTRDITWWVTDSVSFEVRDDRLTMNFLTALADAPVPATAVYRRAR